MKKLAALYQCLPSLLLLLCGMLVAPALFGQDVFYWENPVLFSPGAARFPVSSTNGKLSVLLWQESNASTITLSLAVKTPDQDWVIRRSIAGPYPYSGSEPAIASVVVDARDRIIIAVGLPSNETEILISNDQGLSFSAMRLKGDINSTISPRIVTRSDGGYYLFVTRGQEQSLSIFYSRSEDGLTWTDFTPFVSDSRLKLTFLPSHTTLGSTDYVVFQALTGDVRPTFQLFMTTSSDGGRNWTSPRQVTNFLDPYVANRREPEYFDNQRPFILGAKNTLFLVWERRPSNGNPQVYGMELKPDGQILGTAEQISPRGVYANNPVVLPVNGRWTVFWFDNRRGQNRIYMAQKKGLDWEDTDLSASSGEATFARPILDRSGLYVFWQTQRASQNRLVLLAPDTTVAKPPLRPLNFKNGERLRTDKVQIAWSMPEDSSGILGYSYIWTRDPEEVPPKTIKVYATTTRTEQFAQEDGPWYFAIRAQDFAGNWSDPSIVYFIRDTTPPPAASIIGPDIDENGFLISNTFTIQWNPPPASDVGGYTWNLEYLGPGDLFGQLSLADFETKLKATYPSVSSPVRFMGKDTQASFTNLDNGIWRFTLSVVDTVGNISQPAVYYFRTNKYIPFTIVRYLDVKQDEQGKLMVTILGRGYLEGGNITSIFIDRDGLAPYDREYFLEQGHYRIVSDREIGGITVEDLDAGSYHIGLVHSGRGLYRTGPLLQVDEMGTVKFGDFTQVWQPSWSRAPKRTFTVDVALFSVFAIIMFALLGLFIAVRGIGSVVAETAMLRMDAVALITGEPMTVEKQKAVTRIKRRGMGLGIKLAIFTIILVSMVVLMVSVPLTLMMTRTQERTLLQGLRDRSRVLLESLASGARAYLPAQNVLELGFLPAQTSAVPEAIYATITGFGARVTIFSDHVWATNDPDILTKIDTPEFQPGLSRLKDPISPRIASIAQELDEQARSEVGDISKTIADLTREALTLALKTDAESVRRRDDIQTTTRNLEARLNEKLTQLASNIGSEPEFPTDKLPPKGQSRYIFFKPVLYRQGADDLYFRGLVRLEVTIDSIYAQVDSGRRSLVQVTALIALIALVIGVIGAILVSVYIVSPILKLVEHVKKIKDTEDKSELEGHEISIKSRDEIAVLGDTINEMTHGLVKAALASKDLTIGKEVQKKFIPLETDAQGNKLTTGHLDAKYAEFFGYYEGAKGVSGDYFDYINLDDRYFAVIKCDVAGKGVPAALIMVQVATLFLNSFRNWKPTPEGLNISRVVYEINDLLEKLKFKGRFAAFTLCLFDSQTGLVRFCNAGDNIVHWFDASSGSLQTLTLPPSPAAGVLDNDLIDMKGGYQIQTLQLDPGDVLFLYTDGIEEAKRNFRNSTYEVITCTEGENGTAHGNHVAGQSDEELGYDRVSAIIDAVFNRRLFILEKYHNPDSEQKLVFDFTTCQGTITEAVMALVSVEKIFRLYKDPACRPDERILVDKKIDEFLKAHFKQYGFYIQEKMENAQQKEYLYYMGLREDEQYDDLTILGIRRK
ncbi:SpoIIE family protein phosphatase [Gracilinema caldarium]|uniref:Protein serine/threonine phosphatase with extracellular sensor n=1 Tax=Gracilinema caldarium (strain ATCC 51460 / DSM 7334 / H1) TaxID=744872 RepID=F8EXH5_GRAC1|nr:SpoIIE family protein phosphatase [Gracilinema caldarium]AEJ19202.1 protein serine/threonine phosphatase with extracellular sensor [Gracilinema caldarium DSM 7334]